MCFRSLIGGIRGHIFGSEINLASAGKKVMSLITRPFLKGCKSLSVGAPST